MNSHFCRFNRRGESKVNIVGWFAIIITNKSRTIERIIDIELVDCARRSGVIFDMDRFYGFWFTEVHTSPASIKSGTVTSRVEEVHDVGVGLEIETILDVTGDVSTNLASRNGRRIDRLVKF